MLPPTLIDLLQAKVMIMRIIIIMTMMFSTTMIAFLIFIARHNPQGDAIIGYFFVFHRHAFRHFLKKKKKKKKTDLKAVSHEDVGKQLRHRGEAEEKKIGINVFSSLLVLPFLLLSLVIILDVNRLRRDCTTSAELFKK